MTQELLAAPGDEPPVRLRVAFWALLTALLAIAFWPTRGCQFVFDDIAFLVNNDTITEGNLASALFGRHQLMANRPITGFMLALQYRLFDGATLGFRWVSVLLHLVNVRLLFVVARASLRSPNLAGRFTPARAWWLAAAIAALWGLHPLTVDTVAYTMQQSMLLMVMFLLAAVRMLQRAHAAPHAAKFSGLAILFVALGMATKEEMAPAPLLLLLYERAFLLPDWRALRPRWRFYLGLFGTWLVLAWCIAGEITNTTVGWHVQPHIGAGEWLMTQAGVVLHYVRLALWPQPLKAVYDDGIVREFAHAALPGLGVLLLLASTIVLWRRRPPLGWLGALFFLMLAPTSSIVPIVTEVVSERRAYLPMLAVLVPVVLGVDHAIAAAARRGASVSAALAARVGLAVVATALAIPATRAHVRTFVDESTLWTHAYTSNQLTNRSFATATILSGYAKIVSGQGRADEGFALFERAMQTESQLDAVRLNWALALGSRGRLADSEQVLRDLVRDHPDNGAAIGSLATVLWQRFVADKRTSPDDPRLVEAERLAKQSADLHAAPESLNTLAAVQVQRGRPADAEAALRRAIAIAPNHLASYRNLGGVLLLVGKPREAVDLGHQLARALPGDANVRFNLAQGLLQLNDAAAAVPVLEEVLRIDPGNAKAQALLAQLRPVGR